MSGDKTVSARHLTPRVPAHSTEAMDRLRGIAHLIGECRRRNGWSEDELARQAGVSLSDVRALRDSDPRVSVIVILELVRAVGAQLTIMDSAIEGEDPEVSPWAEPIEDRF